MIPSLRVQQYGSFLYCPLKDTLCFGRYTDEECAHDSCFLDDPEYKELRRRIDRNRMKRGNEEPKPPEKAEPTSEELAWKEIYKKEAMAKKLYRKNKPKLADGLMAEAMYMRGQLYARRGNKP